MNEPIRRPIELPDSEVISVEASMSTREGLQDLQGLITSAGLDNPEDDSDFMGRKTKIIVNGEDELVEALPADTSDPPAPAAAPAPTPKLPPFDTAGFREHIKRL